MKLALNTILLLLVFSLNAQTIDKKRKIIDLSISFAGFGGDYITNSSGIQAEGEIEINSSIGVQCGVRYIYDISKYNSGGYFIVNVDDLKGFLVDIEIKKYNSSLKNNIQGGYFGGRTAYLFTYSTRDNYQIRRYKAGVYGIIGWKYVAVSGFLFEVSAGLGLQIIDSHSNKNNDVDYYIPVEFPWPKPYDEGTGFYPDFTCDVKLGWRL